MASTESSFAKRLFIVLAKKLRPDGGKYFAPQIITMASWLPVVEKPPGGWVRLLPVSAYPSNQPLSTINQGSS
jgi:hypothetical protein